MMGGNFINLIFAGHYSDTKGNDGESDSSIIFAGVSLCGMFINVSYLSIIIGMTTAIETLGSQHNGAGNYAEVGYVFQRYCCVLTVLILPVLVLWYYSRYLFLAVGIDARVCDVIQNLLAIRALTVPLDIFNESYQVYLITLGVTQPGLISTICFNLLLLLCNYIFVDILHFSSFFFLPVSSSFFFFSVDMITFTVMPSCLFLFFCY